MVTFTLSNAQLLKILNKTNFKNFLRISAILLEVSKKRTACTLEKKTKWMKTSLTIIKISFFAFGHKVISRRSSKEGMDNQARQNIWIKNQSSDSNFLHGLWTKHHTSLYIRYFEKRLYQIPIWNRWNVLNMGIFLGEVFRLFLQRCRRVTKLRPDPTCIFLLLSVLGHQKIATRPDDIFDI